MAIRKVKGTNIILGLVILAIIVFIFFGDKLRPNQGNAVKNAAQTKATSTEAKPEVPKPLEARYKSIEKVINIDRVRDSVKVLSEDALRGADGPDAHTRMVGYKCCENAALYV